MGGADNINLLKWQMGQLAYDLYQEVSGGIEIKGEIEYGKIQSKRFTFPK